MPPRFLSARDLWIWGASLVLGVWLMPGIQFGVPVFDRNLAPAQIICSTITFMLVALFAVIAAANEAFRHDRAAAFGDPANRASIRAARVTPLLLALMTLTAALLMYKHSPNAQLAPALQTAGKQLQRDHHLGMGSNGRAAVLAAVDELDE